MTGTKYLQVHELSMMNKASACCHRAPFADMTLTWHTAALLSPQRCIHDLAPSAALQISLQSRQVMQLSGWQMPTALSSSADEL